MNSDAYLSQLIATIQRNAPDIQRMIVGIDLRDGGQCRTAVIQFDRAAVASLSLPDDHPPIPPTADMATLAKEIARQVAK